MHCTKMITSPYESLFINMLLNTAVKRSREKQQFYIVDLSVMEQRVMSEDLSGFHFVFIYLFRILSITTLYKHIS